MGTFMFIKLLKDICALPLRLNEKLLCAWVIINENFHIKCNLWSDEEKFSFHILLCDETSEIFLMKVFHEFIETKLYSLW